MYGDLNTLDLDLDLDLVLCYRGSKTSGISGNISRLFRRRLSAEGAKPESNKRWKTVSGDYVLMYVYMLVCMYVFQG